MICARAAVYEQDGELQETRMREKLSPQEVFQLDAFSYRYLGENVVVGIHLDLPTVFNEGPEQPNNLRPAQSFLSSPGVLTPTQTLQYTHSVGGIIYNMFTQVNTPDPAGLRRKYIDALCVKTLGAKL
ncbi:hypothetical protein ElyMa_000559200 [Elysia marginata]|uniref:Uncharacterized protein n=1 Tax=Elysia marginata TaxID=1093978 RepID=A0AAV4G4I0_9GAST|nr:hypothetical protein ElyMa_000559200 [Elysia marginata]